MKAAKRFKKSKRGDEMCEEVQYALILQGLRDTTRWLSIKASSEERVYVRRAQSRLNDLARICERQRGVYISSREDKEWDQSAKEVVSLIQRAADARGSMVGSGLPRLLELLAPSAGDNGRGEEESQNRRNRINSFIHSVGNETGVRIKRKDVWLVAGYQNATEFERFQRGDSRTTASAKSNFDRVLNSNPADFVHQLEARKSRMSKS